MAMEQLAVTGGSALKINSRGQMGRHPAAIERDRAWAKLKSICREFGLSPSARTGLMMDPTEMQRKTQEDPYFGAKKFNPSA
jgi:P27 family predicted phage terminase small subunit